MVIIVGNERDGYTVGCLCLTEWHPLRDFKNLSDAAAWVHYLNGGTE